MRFAVAFLFLLAVAHRVAAADKPLTLAEAIAAAESHPGVKKAEADQDAASARVDAARAPLLPQVTGSTFYGVARDPARQPWDATQSLQGGFATDVLLYDFGKTYRQLRAAKASEKAGQDGLRAARLDARKNVRAAFFLARARKALVEVAREAAENEKRHLEQIEKFVLAEMRPEIDLYQARALAASARAALVQAQSDYEIAKARLNDAMGVERDTGFDVADETPPAVAGEEGTIDALLAEAIDARPELGRLANARRALELQAAATRSAFGPSLRAGTGVEGIAVGGQQAPTWGWNASLNLIWSIYDGGGRSAALRETNFAIAALDADLQQLRHALRLEIETARLTVRAAIESLGAAKEALENARFRLVLAEKRYAAGLSSAIEQSDAQVELTRVAGLVVQAEYSLALARGQLQDALAR